MKKNLLKILLGAIIVACIIPLCVNLYYSSQRTKYRNQLEQYIDENVLERKKSIGAYSFSNSLFDKDSIQVREVSDFDPNDKLSWMLVKRMTFWGGQNFDHMDMVRKILFGGEYKWYELNQTLTYSPFLIIVNKTDRGYDLIGEYILGIALTNSYPDFLINHTETPFTFGKYGSTIIDEYKVENDFVDDYINTLSNEKYQGITIRNEISKNQYGYDQNVKYDMLYKLAMQGSCPADSSLYYRVNRYFELKPDVEITKIGTQPILTNKGSYGNTMQQLLTQKVTLHYSIQENEGLLDKQCKEYTLICLIIGELIYAIIMFILYKRNKIL